MSEQIVQGRRVWTVEDVRALGLTCDITTAAHVLGIGRTSAFELLRAGQFPVRVLRLGRSLRVPIPDLLMYLGASPTPDAHQSRSPDQPAPSGSGLTVPTP